MNDRFKFRVWDTVDCEYIEDSDIVRLTQYGKFVFNNATNDTEPELNSKRFIFEQCTGLKDKNGKLIYEGDIVAKIDINGFGYPRTRICRVYWKEDWLGWAIETEYGDVYELGDYGSDNFEIIGNIHENPELMEE